jgi:hypothetical protein
VQGIRRERSAVILTIVLASVSMVVADVLGVLLTQAEARNRAVLAGFLDTVGWGAGVIVTLSTLDALNGHNRPLMFGVVAGVSVANFAGSWAGVHLGKRWVHDASTFVLAERITRLEALTPIPPTKEKP